MANVDLTKYGITGTTEIIHNPSFEDLYKYEMDKKWSDNAVSNPKAILEYMGVS